MTSFAQQPEARRERDVGICGREDIRSAQWIVFVDRRRVCPEQTEKMLGRTGEKLHVYTAQQDHDTTISYLAHQLHDDKH